MIPRWYPATDAITVIYRVTIERAPRAWNVVHVVLVDVACHLSVSIQRPSYARYAFFLTLLLSLLLLFISCIRTLFLVAFILHSSYYYYYYYYYYSTLSDFRHIVIVGRGLPRRNLHWAVWLRNSTFPSTLPTFPTTVLLRREDNN